MAIKSKVQQIFTLIHRLYCGFSIEDSKDNQFLLSTSKLTFVSNDSQSREEIVLDPSKIPFTLKSAVPQLSSLLPSPLILIFLFTSPLPEVSFQHKTQNSFKILLLVTIHLTWRVVSICQNLSHPQLAPSIPSGSRTRTLQSHFFRNHQTSVTMMKLILNSCRLTFKKQGT